MAQLVEHFMISSVYAFLWVVKLISISSVVSGYFETGTSFVPTVGSTPAAATIKIIAVYV